MATIHARVLEATIEYEALFPAPVFSLFDQPGRIYDALLAKLETFDASVEDLSIEGDQPDERAIVCSLENGADVTLRPDRLEVMVSEWTFPQMEEVSRVIGGAWQALGSIHAAAARTQTAAFELELDLQRQTYKSVLERFAPAPAAFPEGTETAVVFYLPSDADKGYRDSSLVLNRAELEGGLSCYGTFVYDGAALDPEKIVRAAWQRMAEMLDKLDIRVKE
jgi:hypothetical protein